MTKKSKKMEQPEVFTLQSKLGLADVVNLKSALSKIIEHEDIVHLEATAVASIDTSCLQLLVAFLNARWREGREVVWDGMSEEFLERARLLGVADVLGVAEDASASSA